LLQFQTFRTSKLCLFTLFLTYPYISSNVLSFFACRTVDGQAYMTVDYNLNCYDDKWKSFVGGVVTMVLVYPIGVPLLFAVLLFRNRHRLQETKTLVSMGFLYEAYNDNAWWFELVDTLHKLFLSSLLRFFPREYQMPVALCVVLAHTCVILIGRPYLRQGDDKLHIFAQCYIFLILMGGHICLTLHPEGLPFVVDILLSISSVALLVFFAGAGLLRLIRVVRTHIRNQQRAKLWKKQQTESLQCFRSSAYDLVGGSSGGYIQPQKAFALTEIDPYA
jgi:hypothetical protein